MVAIIMTCFMAFWRWGMSKKRAYEWENRVRLGELLRREGDLPALRVPGEGAFLLGSNRPVTPKEKAIIATIENVTFEKSNVPIPPSAKSSTSRDSMAIGPVRASTGSTDSSTRRRRQAQELYLRATDTPVVRLPGISIFYTGAPTSHSRAPHTFVHFLNHFPAIHSTCIFLHVRTAAQPHVPQSERLMLEASPVWDGVWRGVYRIGYMEVPDFTAAEFTLGIFEKLGRQVEGLTHVLQYTTLNAKRELEGQKDVHWIRKLPERIRAFAINTAWTGVDELIGGIGKGWKVPVGEIVSVGSVAVV
jgi:K+ potassium transporter